MQSNIAWTNTLNTQLQVLDESQVNHRLEPGDLATLRTMKGDSGAIPVWELNGEQQARFIDTTSCGWAQAYTSILSAGEIFAIRYHLGSDKD